MRNEISSFPATLKWPLKLGIILLFLLPAAAQTQPFYDSLATAALQLTEQAVVYDPSYFSIPYPNGDVPADRGVCTDVVIRAYRRLGIDLQRAVHEDMRRRFADYPDLWGLSTTDRNIDHRRVPNLMQFFEHEGEVLPNTGTPSDYRPGDIVCWQLAGGRTHIGIVSDIKSERGDRYQIVHNIGAGQVLEDCLFRFPVIGHYRFGAESER